MERPAIIPTLLMCKPGPQAFQVTWSAQGRDGGMAGAGCLMSLPLAMPAPSTSKAVCFLLACLCLETQK